MMEHLANDLIRKWALADDGAELSDLGDRLFYLAKKLFNDYEPSQFQLFRDRLDLWLGNVDDDEDRKTLYRLAGALFFVGRGEFESLCRAAYHGPITRWLIDGIGISFDDANASEKLTKAVDRTWFCPVTDSMRINAFLKVNKLDGKQYRPDWRSLERFGDLGKINKFITDAKIERIVLLEDFAGTGKQLSNGVSYAAGVNPELPVICCPLVICPDGLDAGKRLVDKHKNLTFEPILILPPDNFVKFEPQADEGALLVAVRALTAKVAKRLIFTDGRETHGFEGTGALAVLYSNCPNNTLPIVHDATKDWHPLFPRIRRQ